jgi:Flp pilus assembly protein TadB
MKKLNGKSLNHGLGGALAAFACIGAIAVACNGMEAKKAVAEEGNYAPAAITASVNEDILQEAADRTADVEVTLEAEAQEPTADTQQGEVGNGKTRSGDPAAQSSSGQGIPIWAAILFGAGAMCAAMIVAGVCISINNRVKWHR